MKIKFHRKFEKQYKKLPEEIKIKTKKVITIFSINPFHPPLKNHSLSGQLKKFRAIFVTPSIRIIFQQFDNYTIVTFLDIGGHDKVYK